MKKLLFIAACLLAIAVPAAFSYGEPTAVTVTKVKPQRLAPAGQRGAHPVRLPAAVPKRDRHMADAWGFIDSNILAKELQKAASGAPAADPAPSGGAGASITVTATVLPTRIIVVNGSGDVTQIWSNTPDRRATHALYIFRVDAVDGAIAGPTRKAWRQARALLLRANLRTGRVA